MLRPYHHETGGLVRGGSGCVRLSFVRAGTVKSWHRNPYEAEINGELSAMMDEVIEAHSANAGDARHGENLLAAG